MKTIFKTKLLILIAIIGLSISCKTSSAPGSAVNTESDAIKAGDSTSLNTGIKGTTRSNEGNGNEADEPVKSNGKSTVKDSIK